MVVIFIQSVEEAECRRAYDSAVEFYISTFDRSKPPEEVSDALVLIVEWLFYAFLSFLILLVLGVTEGGSRRSSSKITGCI